MTDLCCETRELHRLPLAEGHELVARVTGQTLDLRRWRREGTDRPALPTAEGLTLTREQLGALWVHLADWLAGVAVAVPLTAEGGGDGDRP